MKQYLFKFMLSLGAVAIMASCSDDVSLGGEENVPGGYSDKVCFIVTDTDATRGGSAASRRCGGVFLHDSEGTDSIFLALTVADKAPATRASYITEQDYGTLSMTCRKRTEGNTYSYYFADTNFSKNADGVWESDPPYWWLNENTHFNFYGYAPANAQGLKFVQDEQTWHPQLDYTVPSDVKAQADIVYNSLNSSNQEYIASANQVVPLTMTHALANVAFKTGTGMAAGTVNKITVKNVTGRGTLDLTNGQWTLNPASTTDFTLNLDKASADSHPITTDAENTYLMLLPGSNSESTTVELEFTKADGTKETFSGPLTGTWEAGKQYMYSVTVNPDFTITVDSDTQDAHYVICRANVTAANMQQWQEWELTATASDGADVTMLTELNSYQQAGFWTDEVWLQDITDTAPKRTEDSARGSSTLTGTGSSPVYIFLPENAGDTDRTITLTMKVKGESKAVATYDITQLHPDWTAGGYGWEQQENDPQAQWGFEWNRKVTYQKANEVWNGWVYYPLVQDLVAQYNAESFTVVNHNGWENAFWPFPQGFTGRTSIEIDYTKLNDLSSVALTTSDGLENTRKLYSFSGAATTGNLEQAIKDLANRGENGVFNVTQESGTNNMTSAALNYIMRKNRYNWVVIKKQDNQTGQIVTTEAPALNTDEGIVWFLPAKDQMGQGPAQTPLSGEYWSSSPQQGSAQIYTNTGTAARTANKKIRACRLHP